MNAIADACLPAPGRRTRPALIALAQVMAHALAQLAQAVRDSALVADPVADSVAAPAAFSPTTLSRQLADIDGALRLAGACSLAALASLMRQLLSAQAAPSGPAALSSELIDAVCEACESLMAALPALQDGQAISPSQLMPVWRRLSALMPTPPLTPAAMISLELDAVALDSAQALILPHACSVGPPVPAADVDRILLALLRADAGSENLREGLQAIAAVITGLSLPSASSTTPALSQQRLHWAIMRIFCDQLAVDDALDLALAKRSLAAVVRAIRHSSSAGSVLNEQLVREVLYQLGLCASPTADCLLVRQCFRLAWQLGETAPAPSLQASRAVLHSLREQIDELIACWPGANMTERRAQMDELALSLGREPLLASSAASFAALTANLSEHHEMTAAASVLILRECVERLIAGHDLLPAITLTSRAFDELAAGTGWAMAPQQPCAYRHPALARLMLSGSLAALQAAITGSLLDAEQRLDGLLDEGDRLAAVALMRQTLSLTSGALAMSRQSDAWSLSEALRQALAEAMQRAKVTNNDFSALAAQWVQLCARVEAWRDGVADPVQDTPETECPAVLAHSDERIDHTLVSASQDQAVQDSAVQDDVVQDDVVQDDVVQEHSAQTSVAPVLSLDTPAADTFLRQIFTQEASQRLARLKDSLFVWSADPNGSLPIEAAHEAHALAGSSATVGMMRVHQWSLALEQLIEQLMLLPSQQQKLHAPEVMDGLQALERQLLLEQEAMPSAPPAIVQDSPAVPGLVLQDAAQDQARHFPPPALADHSVSTDAELLALFSEEAAELLPQLQQLLGQWNDAPADKSLPRQLLRLLHTLKGSARMAGDISLGERLHRMEHEIGELSLEGKIGQTSIGTLQAEVTQLLGHADLPATDQAAPMPQSRTQPAEDSEGGVEPQKPGSAGAAPKVRADLLERAAGTAAELLVGAVRAAEDLQRQRQMLAELSENLARLRTQLRELELQSESRIAAQALPSASTFDPLEFDRYTRLQELTRMTAESLADLTSMQRSLARQTDTSATLLSQQTRHARLLQSDLRRVRMQAFSSAGLRLRHLARQAALESGREVSFELDGGQVEIDRIQLDRLNGALQHLICNAVVHGIEAPAQRESAGKPRCGLVRLSLSQQGGELRLQVSDDGRGLDLLRIRERAIARGLLDAEAAPDDAALAELIFAPGLSTAEEVTGLAGRGIGLDAVKAAVTLMGGALKIDSLAGAGTCITLALPQLMSTQQVVTVSEGEHRIALPSSMVQQLIQLSAAAVRQASETGSIEWQRQRMPLRSLAGLLGAADTGSSNAQRVPVIVLRQLDQWLAVKVDEVQGHREVVFKPPGAQLAGVPGLSGLTLMPDGSVMLIMNLLQLMEHRGAHPRIVSSLSNADDDSDKAPLVMVVDDSLTVRRVSQRLLERHGYAVAVARHGVEALEQLQELTPAALLLDIEMPRMDGFELLGRLRADARFREIPVAMITSRAAERHRQHAMQLGANAYFGKPYREHELFEWLGLWVPLPGDAASSGAGEPDAASRAAA